MNNNYQKIIFALGVIAAIYLVVKFVLPFLWWLFLWILKIIIGIAAIVALFFIVRFILQTVKER